MLGAHFFQEYDNHGIWPPPAPVPEHHRHHNATGFNDPFFTDPFFSSPFFNSPHRRAPHSSFTDPFVLFNSLFDDIFHDMQPHHNHRHDIFNPVQSHTVGFPFGFGSGFFGGFGSLPNGASQMMSNSYQTSYMNDGSEPRWISQSSMTRTINGVTETVQERIDSNVSR
jgi:DnaJ family protein B protein 6